MSSWTSIKMSKLSWGHLFSYTVIPLYNRTTENLTKNSDRELIAQPITAQFWTQNCKTLLSPCWSAVDFWKIKFEKSSWTNLIFCPHILKLNFAGYRGSKNQVGNRQKIKFVQLDLSNSIFQKSTADQQGVWDWKSIQSCCCSLLHHCFCILKTTE